MSILSNQSIPTTDDPLLLSSNCLSDDDACDRALMFLDSCGVGIVGVYGIDSRSGGCACNKGVSCPSPGKHPRMGSNWQQKKINSSSGWYVREKDRLIGKVPSNYGVKTGAVSNIGRYLIVIDVDISTHFLLDELKKSNTFTVRTGSGGYHFYFWSNQAIGNSVSLVADKIDIRGTGGFVVAPGSYHASGTRYLPIESASGQYAIQNLPEWIARTISKTKSKTAFDKTKTVKDLNKLDIANSPVKVIKRRRLSFEDREKFSWYLTTPANIISHDLVTQQDLTIPAGIRHQTMTRLIGYEVGRLHKKQVTLKQFNKNIALYCRKTEGWKKDFLPSEVRRILNDLKDKEAQKVSGSGSKEDRIAGYVSYMKSIKHDLPSFLPELLSVADDYFFTQCIQEDESGIRNKRNFTPIRTIIKRHKEFLTKLIGHAFSYSDKDMAKRLKSLGYYRTQFYDRPLWSCQFNEAAFEISFKKFCQRYIIEDKMITFPIESLSSVSAYVKERKGVVVVSDMLQQLGEKKFDKERVTSMTIINKGGSAKQSVLHDDDKNAPAASTTGTSGSLPTTIKIKRKKHPAEPRYPGRPNLEMSTAFSQLLFLLTPEQSEELVKGTLILDAEGSIDDAREIKVGDKIGIALQFDNGFVPTIVEIESVEGDINVPENMIFNCLDRYQKSDIDFSFHELSIARALGYYDVMFRDGKLHGVPEFEEMSVKFAIGDKVFDPSNPADAAELEKEIKAEQTAGSSEHETKDSSVSDNTSEP